MTRTSILSNFADILVDSRSNPLEAGRELNVHVTFRGSIDLANLAQLKVEFLQVFFKDGFGIFFLEHL